MFARAAPLKIDRVIARNAAALAASSVLTYGLGFVYWWLMARLFPSSSVGLASAAITGLLFVSRLGLLGAGTLLIGELPKRPGEKQALIGTALAVVVPISCLLGAIYIGALPRIDPEMAIYADSAFIAALFVSAVAASTLGTIIDHIFIALLKSHRQFLRNASFAVGKALLLVALAFAAPRAHPIWLVMTWCAGDLLSSVIAIGWQRLRHLKPAEFQPRRHLVRELKGAALGHHVLNTLIDVPHFLLPTLVLVLLSSTESAVFYVTWLLSTFTTVAAAALATSLYAVGTTQASEVPRKLRFTLGVSLLLCGTVSVALVVGADAVLRLFGETYVNHGSTSLRLLAGGAFLGFLRIHYLTLKRISGKLRPAIFTIGLTSTLQLVGAGCGALAGGLSGLSFGWLLAAFIEAGFVSPTVLRTAFLPPPSPPVE